jgi:ribonuclease E
MPADQGSFFMRKVGPLPVWAWAAIALGAFYLYRKYAAGTSSTAGTTGTAAYTPPTESVTLPGGISATGTGGDINDLLAWLAAQQAAGTAAPGAGSTTAGSGTSGASGGTTSGTAPAPSGPAPGAASPSPGNGGGTPGQASEVDVYQSGAVYVFQPGQQPQPETGQGQLVAAFADPNAQYYGGTNPGGGLPTESYGYVGGQSPTPIASAAATPGGGYTLINQQGQRYAFGPGPGQFNINAGK